MRKEIWNNHSIRFIEKDNEWWAIAKDVTDALEIKNVTMALKRIDSEYQALTTIEGLNRGNVPVNIINEFGIYKIVLSSRKPEARDFEKWMFNVIKELRTQSGLAGFEVFRMMDKEHQKEMMGIIRRDTKPNGRINYIKANTITNKAVSNKHGFKKMVKKCDMTPQMLVDRQPILEDTVELMSISDKFNIEFPVAQTIYKKHN